MARILGIGNATLDIVNIVNEYPLEDSEQRAIDQRISRGGNCANTLVVLSQLGHDCAWAGVLADDPNSIPICLDFDRYQIDYSAAERFAGGKVPTSYIINSRCTATRTIVHWRDLPEYPAERFFTLALERYDWLHFEGRNLDQVKRMLAHVKARHPHKPVSIEIEKSRDGIEALFDDADLLLFSRGYAEHCGFSDACAFLEHLRPRCRSRWLVCGWGDRGAAGIEAQGSALHVAASPVPLLVETLGAGDVFNAGMIHALLKGASMTLALTAACGLAARKCATSGFDLGLQGDTHTGAA